MMLPHDPEPSPVEALTPAPILAQLTALEGALFMRQWALYTDEDRETALRNAEHVVAHTRAMGEMFAEALAGEDDAAALFAQYDAVLRNSMALVGMEIRPSLFATLYAEAVRETAPRAPTDRPFWRRPPRRFRGH